jgi:hypothetical protein
LYDVDILKTFKEVGIAISQGSFGEVRTTCPHCSVNRKNSHDKCLAVNVSQGVWHCHHCGWTDKLWRPDYRLPSLPRRVSPASVAHATPPPDDVERRRERLKALWREARPVTAADAAGRYLRLDTAFVKEAPAGDKMVVRRMLEVRPCQ